MGASIKVDGRTAIVRGVKKLTGAEVKPAIWRGAWCWQDWRGRETVVIMCLHIDRGLIDRNKLIKLGADIHRV